MPRASAWLRARGAWAVLAVRRSRGHSRGGQAVLNSGAEAALRFENAAAPQVL
jgi:hypothetical protein